MKLFARYNRINLAITALLLILSALAYYFVVNRILIHELDEELDNYKEKIESFAQKTGGLPEPGALEDLRVTYDPDDDAYAPQYIMTSKYDSDEQKVEPFRELIYTQRAGAAVYKVSIGKPLEGVHFLAKTIVYSTLLILAIMALVSWLVNHFVLRRLWRPFYGSMNSIKNFRLQGKSPPEFPQTRTDEFRFMNERLDQVIQNAQTDYRLLKEFTENASHEIQTPLAIIRSKLDLLIQEESLSEKQGKILDSAYAAVTRISRLNQSLLLLAKIENHQFNQTQVIDLKKEVEEKIEEFSEFWQNYNIHISVDLDKSLINANQELIDILLNNLLGNAGMHNREGGKVDIELTADRLTVSNTGSLEPLDTLRLFRRFYKETQNSHHNGLGLSIIKQICDQAGIAIQYSFAYDLHTFHLSWRNELTG
jgi:signal transduction histidine kinase